VTECERLRLVPVTPTWYVPADVNVQDRLEVPEPATLVGDSVQEVLLVVRLTTPEKLLMAVMVMVELPVALTFTLMLVGLAVIE
jgi:hypothetical protein